MKQWCEDVGPQTDHTHMILVAERRETNEVGELREF